MNNIDWGNMTVEEGQELVNMLAGTFSLVAKSYQDQKRHDVSYLEVVGFYDDEFHAHERGKMIGAEEREKK